MERICQQHQILRDSRTWWIQPVPRSFLRIQFSWERTSDFCNLPTLRSLTSSSLALQKALSHLETSVREIELVAFINWGHMAFYRTSKPWKCYWELNSPNSFQEHRCTCMYKPSFMVIYETSKPQKCYRELNSPASFQEHSCNCQNFDLNISLSCICPCHHITQTVPAQEVHWQPFLSYFAVSAT